MKVKVTQSFLTLCDPMDYTVHKRPSQRQAWAQSGVDLEQVDALEGGAAGEPGQTFPFAPVSAGSGDKVN